MIVANLFEWALTRVVSDMDVIPDLFTGSLVLSDEVDAEVEGRRVGFFVSQQLA